MMCASLLNQKLANVVNVTPLRGIPYLRQRTIVDTCEIPIARVTYIVHDDIKRGNSVRSDKEQLVGILLIWKGVDVPHFALGKQVQFGHVGGGELQTGRMSDAFVI